MGFMTIDGKQVEFTDEPNVLSVIRKPRKTCLETRLTSITKNSVPDHGSADQEQA